MIIEFYGWIDFDIVVGSMYWWFFSLCYCCLSGERVIVVFMIRLRVKIVFLSFSVFNWFSFFVRYDIFVFVLVVGWVYRIRYIVSFDVVCSFEFE